MSTMSLPQIPGAFSAYKPSTAAHTDFLSGGSSSTDAAKDVKVIKLIPSRRPVPSSPQDDLQTIQAAIGPILRGEKTATSFHHLSATCHRLVAPPHGMGSAIHSAIKTELGKSVDALVKQWRRAVMGRDKDFLESIMRDWRTWEKRVDLLAAIFVYLDKLYAPEQASRIKPLALDTFRTSVWGDDIIRGKIKDEILAWATGERSTDSVDEQKRATVKFILEVSKRLDVFSTLSDPYVELANTYFSDTAEQRIQTVETGQGTAAKYVAWARTQGVREKLRARACFNHNVAEQVLHVVRVHTGYKMSKRIVRRALDEAMDSTDAKALIDLYAFTCDVNIFEEFIESLRAHIEERMRALISDPANDPQMIDQTLKLKRFTDKSLASMFDGTLPPAGDYEGPSGTEDELDLIEADGQVDGQEDMEHISLPQDARHVDAIKRAGLDDGGPSMPKLDFFNISRRSDLEDAVRKGFYAGMSSRENAPAEWIAKHLDAAMRKGQGQGTEAEFNQLLDEIIALIGFTRDKDVFKAFYSTQLAKRLLLNKSASDDMERNMIIKLQKEMGEEFTSGDIMMKDLQLSETLVKSYQAARIKNPAEYTDDSNLTANVLTESAWPAYPQLKDGWNFKLTPELQASIDAFTAWYGTQHRNRQLSWRPQLGTVTMTARFKSGKYEIGVSLFQAVVLLHFNEDDSLEVQEIQARTGIEEKELARILQSLSMGRKGTRVLLKKPPGKEVQSTDTFAWNKAFTSDRIKFRINQIQQDMSAEESKKTNEQVIIDRVSVLEATIVRIMKGKKKMTLQLLIDAVVSDVSKRFPPDVKEMKKRVESLIEREFLIRDEDDRNLLHYLA